MDQIDVPEIVKLNLRVPSDLKDWVAREAERQERSQNAIAVRALRAARDLGSKR